MLLLNLPPQPISSWKYFGQFLRWLRPLSQGQAIVSNMFVYLGSGCSTAVEHMPRTREVVGSNSVGCWAFSLLYLISSASSIRSLMEVQHYWFSFKMFSHAALGEASLIITNWAKNNNHVCQFQDFWLLSLRERPRSQAHPDGADLRLHVPLLREDPPRNPETDGSQTLDLGSSTSARANEHFLELKLWAFINCRWSMLGFFFLYFRLYCAILPMVGNEPGISGVRGDHSTNCAETTAPRAIILDLEYYP